VLCDGDDRRVVPPLLSSSSTSSSASTTLSLSMLSKKERRELFEAQVKAFDELLQEQQLQEQQLQQLQQQQLQQQLPDTTFYQGGSSTGVGYQDSSTLGFTDSGLALSSYAVDPDQSQLYPADLGGLVPQQDLYYPAEQPAYQCKYEYIFNSLISPDVT